MLEWLHAWRGELATSVTVLGLWMVFKFIWHRPYWRLCLAGMIVGLGIEVMTEPLWNYSMRSAIWRDLSPFTVAGWGPMFGLICLGSETLYFKFFKRKPDHGNLCLVLTDILVGVPVMLGGESFGMHVLKVWAYSPILEWHAMIPLIQYPWAGLAAMIGFVAIFPSAVRMWDRQLEKT